MATFGYVRVSTGRQASEGDSLDTQMRQLQGYALQHGWTIDRVFREEGVDAEIALGDRPQGAEMMAGLRAGDVVVAAKLDRVFRSALDALQTVEKLRAIGVKLHLLDLGGDVSGNGLARFFMTMAAAFAEMEKQRIKERVGDVKRDQRQRGRFLGGTVPFGFGVDEDGALVEVPIEQRALRMILKLRKQGLALRPIAEQVGRKHGVGISHVTVSRVLKEAGVV